MERGDCGLGKEEAAFIQDMERAGACNEGAGKID